MSTIPLRLDCSLLTCVAIIACPHHTEAQLPSPQEPSTAPPDLVATIAALDSAMFAAFNAHDAERLATFFTPDLEFYHDKGGFAGFDSTMANFRSLFARNAETGLHRELVPGTLEVYPIGDFGLLEICQHRFCHDEGGKQDCGNFKNIMVWRNDRSGYRVSRVISYDH
ncbi:MAG: nuclear transport factor 2 family protein [Flavobacteriales bacterium]